MDTVQELEHYLSKNSIDAFITSMMTVCLKEKPEEPAQYLLKYMLEANANKSSEQVAVASTTPAPALGASSSAQPPQPGTHVALSHPDQKTQQYLTDKKVHIIFLELLKQVVAEQPDNALSFIALQAHNLHKAPPASLNFS